MKKRFSLLLTGLLLSMLLVFAGCGEGKGAEDTGEDGKVGDRSKTTSSTSSHTAATTNGNVMDDMKNGAEDLVEDILPGDNMATNTNGANSTTTTR